MAIEDELDLEQVSGLGNIKMQHIVRLCSSVALDEDHVNSLSVLNCITQTPSQAVPTQQLPNLYSASNLPVSISAIFQVGNSIMSFASVNLPKKFAHILKQVNINYFSINLPTGLVAYHRYVTLERSYNDFRINWNPSAYGIARLKVEAFQSSERFLAANGLLRTELIHKSTRLPPVATSWWRDQIQSWPLNWFNLASE